ncbi:acetyl-CoA carboxylase biotin carboxylase subunit family protein [Kitasatospora sp. NPDC059327]|uniref:ATP-grasp domain-containing protein n=1 Tax=Kitasatospora sp. NPDC059327 TaxID=3346803 RepID=UPI0036C78D80
MQDEHDPQAVLAAVPRPDAVRVVTPANEYGVVAAAALAEQWGLPGATLGAALVLRDKLRLRMRCRTAGIPQPAFREAFGARDVRVFRELHGGVCVLKPTNRQGSLVVLPLGPDDGLGAAWAECVADEAPLRRPKRALPTRYLVEERLTGEEVSTEALVHRGEVVFVNVTAKRVQSARRPVELGHVVPTGLPADLLARLTGRLVEATGFASA